MTDSLTKFTCNACGTVIKHQAVSHLHHIVIGVFLMASAPAFVAERVFADYERLKAAIRRYASHQPLDLKTPRELQEELLAIAGEPHRHRASIGDDSCLLCGRDLRNEVHHDSL